MNLYPLRFKPVYKDYLWGNSRLPKWFGREADEGIYAESWEISAHNDGMSMVENGPLSGRSLASLCAEYSAELLGSNVKSAVFPLLIKLIDAAQPLSVQVHPNNENAASVNEEPKTEMWYFLNEEPAQVYCGLKSGTTRADFLAAVENESLETLLRVVPAEKGEAVFVPGGCIHSIDSGCLILEIQQNSNTTYRVYDWGRVGEDEHPRELHVEKALQVVDFENELNPKPTRIEFEENGVWGSEICCSPFFRVDQFVSKRPFRIETDGSSFHALFIPEGIAKLVWEEGVIELPTGTSLLVPATLGAYEIVPSGGPVIVLRTTIPADSTENL